MLTVLAHGGQITGDELAFIGLGGIVLLSVLGMAVRRVASSVDTGSESAAQASEDSPQNDPTPAGRKAREG